MKANPFIVAGHGEQTPCAPDDKTEIDGMDEALVPCDAVDDKATWIIDNVCSSPSPFFEHPLTPDIVGDAATAGPESSCRRSANREPHSRLHNLPIYKE